MKQILDQPKNPKQDKRTFSLLSFCFSLSAILTGLFLFSIFPDRITVGEEFPKSIFYLSFLVLLLTIGAIVFTIISFFNKESNSWLKWVGSILTLILIIFYGYTFSLSL